MPSDNKQKSHFARCRYQQRRRLTVSLFLTSQSACGPDKGVQHPPDFISDGPTRELTISSIESLLYSACQLTGSGMPVTNQLRNSALTPGSDHDRCPIWGYVLRLSLIPRSEAIKMTSLGSQKSGKSFASYPGLHLSNISVLLSQLVSFRRKF
jgi:hypothetical protein